VVAFTVATAGAVVPKVIVAAVAPAGCCAEATTVAVAPLASDNVAGVTLSDVIPVGSAVTVMAAAAVSVVVVKPVPEPVTDTVIVATPGATAVTTPVVAFTVATAAFDVVNCDAPVTAEPARLNVGTIVTVWFTGTLAAVGDTCKPLIAAAGAATETDAAAD
jgi:hypothetical protein